jgi:glycosyltransferase involved in cell wall biosynthesis
MSKPLLAYYGPVDTFSGYGSRSRDLVLSLIKLKEPEFDVRIISCNWGACPKGFLKDTDPEHKKIMDRVLPNGQLPKHPDIWIMHTVPNEMQRVGSVYNILVTAGMESTICLPEWVEGCNRADLVIVSSEHAKTVFESSTFQKKDDRTGQPLELTKLSKPIKVLFEGVNTTVYKKTTGTFNLDQVEEPFAFLVCGHWLAGDINQDRKNISGAVKIFLEAFKNRKNPPALVMKVSGGSPSIIDREDILDKIDMIKRTVKATTLPQIYLLYGELTDTEMNELYAHPKIKSMILFTKGEGFGRPLLEFSVQAKPLIVSKWSGHLDFLAPEFNLLIPGTLEKIHPSAVVNNLFHPESQWFSVNASEAAHAMKDVFEHYDKYLEPAKRQAYRSRTEFSLDKMTESLKDILDASLPKMSVPISIKLPVLKKLEIPEELKIH